MIFVLYVDDLLLTGSDVVMLTKIELQLEEQFENVQVRLDDDLYWVGICVYTNWYHINVEKICNNVPCTVQHDGMPTNNDSN